MKSIKWNIDCTCDVKIIEELFDDMFHDKLRNQELILLFWILQAVVTERRE